jgi:predicted Zn-dependent protease
MGATKVPIALPASDPLMLASIKTFRRLRNESDFAGAEPERIRIIDAGPESRIEDLAQGSPLGKYALQELRLMNALYPDKEPTPGQKLKIVE